MPEFQFDSVGDFLFMGGYAIYVWPVYLLFAVFFIVTVFPPLFSRKRIFRQLIAQIEREESQ